MDPNATLLELLARIAERDTEGALGALCDLNDWLTKGGFVPPLLQVMLDAASTET